MIVIVSQGGIDLAQTQMGMLPKNFLWTPAVSEVIPHDFGNLNIGVVDPNPARPVDHDMGDFNRRVHDEGFRTLQARMQCWFHLRRAWFFVLSSLCLVLGSWFFVLCSLFFVVCSR